MHGFPEQDTVWKKMDILVIALSFTAALSAACISGNERGSDRRCGDWREQLVGASAFVKAKAEMPANYLISAARRKRFVNSVSRSWHGKRGCA